MASPSLTSSLALPGVLFVGEDERARLVAHLGPAAGWMIPKGILGWSTEVSVVARESLDEKIRRDLKIVMPEEQIPQAKMPLAHQAALKSPLVAVSGRLTSKLAEAGIRVHTVGADRVTSSFYYIGEGGSEAPVRVEGDLVAAVGAMLGERADNAAIERVLDGLVDRLLRSLSKDRVAELSLELAASLPRAAADGSGMNEVDLDGFEAELAKLVSKSEKYTPFLQDIATKIEGSNERRVDIPLFGDARKVSQGPFELMVGQQKVSLVTHERWLATGPLTEPSKAARVADAARSPAPAPAASPASPQRVPAAAPAKVDSPKPPVAEAVPANIRPLAAPINPPRPKDEPAPVPVAQPEPAPAPVAQPAPVAAAPAPPPPAAEPPKPMEHPPKVEIARELQEPEPAPKPVAVAKAEPRPEPKASVSDSEPPGARDRLTTTSKVKRKEGGAPWVWIIIIAAAAFAAYRLLFAHK